MSSPALFLLAGLCLLLAVLLPALARPLGVTPPLVLLVVGIGLGFSPVAEQINVDAVADRAVIEHVTELTVLIALMGVGLAIDRPLRLLSPRRWRHWSPTWRLLAIAMPLTIGAVALLGWAALGLGPAAALLLGAVLAPTDPVLASDVQVGGPGSAMGAEDGSSELYEDDPTVISEEGEVRFALTSEAGLNDGLAFPFVHGALLIAAGGSLVGGALEWGAWYLLGKVAIGVAVGLILGLLLARLAFARRPVFRLAEQGEPLLALAALLTAYGVSELVGGYGFLGVFTCAMTLRSAERGHDYHRGMHSVVERLERLFTLAVLIFLGIALSSGLLTALDWRGILVAVALIFVIRPLSGAIALKTRARRAGLPGGSTRRGEWAIAFFGVRGVGSLYYLAYASGHADFTEIDWLWATVGFTIALSVVVHGIAAKPVIDRLQSGGLPA